MNYFIFNTESIDKRSFEKWQRNQNSYLSEAALRKRKLELYALVNKVIHNELSADEQELLRMYWYENMSVGEIAQILGIEKTTVYRRIDKITDIIYDKLKYAVEYRYGEKYAEKVRPIIKKEGSAFYTVKANTTGERLKNLRHMQGLSLQEIGEMAGIKPSRLAEIERNENKADAQEIASLSLLYKKSCDYLIFGERKYH